jgi:two-component system response regulator FlrC
VEGLLATDGLQAAVKSQEQHLIHCAIEATDSRTEAAKKLGISPRTLRYKLAKLRGFSPGLTATP